MSFFYKNIYSNAIQQKFLIQPNKVKSNVSFEIKFENLENLDEELVLKSFYFFLLIFGLVVSFKNFSSRYHLGKTFYSFKFFLNFKPRFFDMFLINFFTSHLTEPNKVSFSSKIHNNNLSINLSDLKNFYLVESNPHFFKWEKDLIINCSLDGFSLNKTLSLYFFSLENFKLKKFNNFWTDYVS